MTVLSLYSIPSLLHSLLSQYRFCAGGVGLGAAYAIRMKKGAMPMVVAGAVGSVADLVYGYSVACFQQVQDYREAEDEGGQKDKAVGTARNRKDYR
jgi:hypothetical protein